MAYRIDPADIVQVMRPVLGERFPVGTGLAETAAQVLRGYQPRREERSVFLARLKDRIFSGIYEYLGSAMLLQLEDGRVRRILLSDEQGVKHDITDVTIHSLRTQLGIMLQDSFIFTGTILDNIRYGRLNATDEEVRQAAAVVRADDFIREMPQQYETSVNERGSSLSQGQRQLIAFARTLLSDPRILILDEATSSIDTKTEKLLQDGIQALLKGRTSFIIAHRLSTIKNCDRILYIGNKGIMEAGSHDELMAKKGAYYELYTAQAREQGVNI